MIKKIVVRFFFIILVYGLLACSIPPAKNNHEFSNKKKNSVMWLGHATTLFNVNGKNFLTDPLLTDCLVVLKRKNKIGLTLAQLPKIDVILISHAHIDHFHKSTLRQLDKSTKIIVPKELYDDTRALGFTDIIAIQENQTVQFDGIEVIAKAVKHAAPSLSYIIDAEKTIYFGGDSAYFDGYKEIAKQYTVDLALLAIGPIHAESLKAHHLTPEQAIRAFQDLNASKVLPIHHSTFRQGPAMIWPFININDELKIFKQQLANNHISNQAFIVSPGDIISFE